MTDLAAPPEPEAPPKQRLSNAWRVLATAAVFGLLVDSALQTRAGGAAALGAAAMIAVVLLAVREVTSLPGRALVAASVVPAVFLFIRSSGWVTIPSLLAVFVLLSLGLAVARQRPENPMGFRDVAAQVAALGGAMVAAPLHLVNVVASAAGSDDPRRRRVGAGLLKGLALAAPVASVLALLLASADGVFASLFEISVDAPSIAVHLTVWLAGMCVATGVLVRSSRSGQPRARGPLLRIGALEASMVLGALISVYGAFALSRLLVLRRGSEWVLEQTGLTYAEYARSGFFQLLWAAGITLVVLLVMRSGVEHRSPRSRRTMDVMSLVAVALTLVVVATAVRRLGLYEDAFGLTMLRLYSTALAWWIGSVFAMFALSVVVVRFRRWLPAAVVGSILIALIALNTANPERIVVERNVERAAAGEDFDVAYAVGLGDDAVPSLLDSVEVLPGRDRAAVLAALCPPPEPSAPTEWNLAALRAKAAVADSCG